MSTFDSSRGPGYGLHEALDCRDLLASATPRRSTGSRLLPIPAAVARRFALALRGLLHAGRVRPAAR